MNTSPGRLGGAESLKSGEIMTTMDLNPSEQFAKRPDHYFEWPQAGLAFTPLITVRIHHAAAHLHRRRRRWPEGPERGGPEAEEKEAEGDGAI